MKFKEFFYFQKSDRSVFIFLLTIAVISTALIFELGGNDFDNTEPSDTNEDIADNHYRHHKRQSYKHEYYYAGEQKVELFPFDPNTADSTQLLRLGLRPWQVRNIYKYRSHGGIYRKPSDFAKLYGLTRKQYLAMAPYIQISEDELPASRMFEHNGERVDYQHDSINHIVKIKPYERISLNTADTNQLKRVPGIGSYFAHQIVSYRKRLGGFHSLNQLTEIENFPQESLKYLSIPDGGIEKIYVNKFTLNQLKKHPYINFYQARAICDYRRIKGQLHNLNELKLLKDFTPETIKRLEPYVVF